MLQSLIRFLSTLGDLRRNVSILSLPPPKVNALVVVSLGVLSLTSSLAAILPISEFPLLHSFALAWDHILEIFRQLSLNSRVIPGSSFRFRDLKPRKSDLLRHQQWARLLRVCTHLLTEILIDLAFLNLQLPKTRLNPLVGVLVGAGGHETSAGRVDGGVGGGVRHLEAIPNLISSWALLVTHLVIFVLVVRVLGNLNHNRLVLAIYLQ